jgi:hypothetical protein
MRGFALTGTRSASGKFTVVESSGPPAATSSRNATLGARFPSDTFTCNTRVSVRAVTLVTEYSKHPTVAVYNK